MAEVTFSGVTKVFADGTQAVADMDLVIADGEFVVLVGPSGCGKSTALRMLAGLETITSGTVSIGGTVVNDVTPRDRDIAMVFQNYALYPHMKVYDNIAFGLRLRKVPKDEIDKRVRHAAQVLGLENLLDRKPRALSGGQRQRVAMGRAIVREPQAFLMDEPLSNLDAKLRVEMRAEISSAAGRARSDDGLRDPRPDRGHDHGRPRGGDAQGRVGAGGDAPGALRPAREPVRRRLHRQSYHEHDGGDGGRRTARDCR